MISNPAISPNDSRISALIHRSREQLQLADADAPYLSALALLEHAAGLTRSQILAHPEWTLDPHQVAELERLVNRRCAREPLAYLLGQREFFGRNFQVTPDTLIPRPETEQLVQIALDRLDCLDPAIPVRVLDVGTGSGAIAVTIAACRGNTTVVATDVSRQALATARINVEKHEVSGRVHLVACDLAEAVDAQFSLVVANLPYIPREVIPTLQPEVRAFEPRLALDGGSCGTDLITRLINVLPRMVCPGGCAVLEFGDGQASRLHSLSRSRLKGWATSIRPDASGRDRFLVLERPT